MLCSMRNAQCPHYQQDDFSEEEKEDSEKDKVR